MYLSGALIGGAWGLREGLTNPEATTNRLRFNSVLNALTRRGPFVGNNAGILALMYNMNNGIISSVRGRDDSFNSIVAGGLTGMIFRATGEYRLERVSFEN